MSDIERFHNVNNCLSDNITNGLVLENGLGDNKRCCSADGLGDIERYHNANDPNFVSILSAFTHPLTKTADLIM